MGDEIAQVQSPEDFNALIAEGLTRRAEAAA